MSQREQVLKYLQRGRTLTHLAAFRLFGVNRLAARVHDLRELGHPIKAQRIRLASRKNIARYYLAS